MQSRGVSGWRESARTEGRSVAVDVDALDVIFTHFPNGILLFDEEGLLRHGNLEAERLLGRSLNEPSRASAERCCDLFHCGSPDGPLRRCLTEMALGSEDGLPEVRIDVGPTEDSAVWVTARRSPGGVIVSLRAGSRGDRRRRTEPHWIDGPGLRIQTLGVTRVSSGQTSLGGGWLEHRTGQLLKFLIAGRPGPMHAEQIAAALWPAAGRESLGNLRQCVHALREKLEPKRPRHSASSFVLARGGGYELNREHIRIDADEFERHAHLGLTATRSGDARLGLDHLSAAMELYGGDFLGDEPYADWAFAERDRLRDLAGEVLRALSEIHLADGEFDQATRQLQRLASVDPFDVDVQRQLIGLHLGAGRRSQAVRRYERLRQQMLQAFGEDLDFALSDLTDGRSRRADPERSASAPVALAPVSSEVVAEGC